MVVKVMLISSDLFITWRPVYLRPICNPRTVLVNLSKDVLKCTFETFQCCDSKTCRRLSVGLGTRLRIVSWRISLE